MAIDGIIGRKVGMTQVYAEDGRAIPATVIQAGPCVVVQRKSRQPHTNSKGQKRSDQYEAVQLAFVEDRKVKKGSTAQAGHFKKTGGDVAPVKVLREFKVA